MNYRSDKEFVVHLYDMARKYDSEFLRSIADRMDYIIEERKRDKKYIVCLETVGRSTST